MVALPGSFPIVLALALTLVAGAAPARADDGESALSISAGYSSFAIPEHEPPGGALGLEYEHGIGDSMWVRAAAAGGVYGGDEGAAYAGLASLGITYVVDVLRYLPYLHAGVGGALLGGGALDTQAHPLVELGAGVDLLRGRDLSYGLWARVGSFIDDSATVGAGFRVTWRWGFF
jgi:hypothetical protein